MGKLCTCDLLLTMNIIPVDVEVGKPLVDGSLIVAVADQSLLYFSSEITKATLFSHRLGGSGLISNGLKFNRSAFEVDAILGITLAIDVALYSINTFLDALVNLGLELSNLSVNLGLELLSLSL